jgi:hypothetical protein
VTFASGFLFAVALVLVFLTSWMVLPAPNYSLLALGVGAPELSPWLALGGLVVCVLPLGASDRDIWRGPRSWLEASRRFWRRCRSCGCRSSCGDSMGPCEPRSAMTSFAKCRSIGALA